METDMTKKMILAIAMAAPLMIALPAAADGDHRAKAIAVIKKDFQPRGQAGLDRLAEDGVQADLQSHRQQAARLHREKDGRRISWRPSSTLPTAS
jgi:hypothetical protein